MKIISIRDMLNMLEIKDLRTARKWCERNGVKLIKQGKLEFAFEINFKEVFEKPFINNLKLKFGKDWESAYRLYSEGNIPALNILQSNEYVTKKAYKPEAKLVQDYLLKFKEHGKIKAA